MTKTKPLRAGGRGSGGGSKRKEVVRQDRDTGYDDEERDQVVDEEGDEDIFDEMDESSEGEDQDDESDPGEEELDDIKNRLLSAIDKFSSTNSKSAKDIYASQQAKESSFGIELDDKSVSMNALLDALSNTKGISAVRKSLNDLEKTIEAPKYVDKVVSERIERDITYQGKKEDMGKWQEQVLANRHAKTLDLAHDKRDSHSYRSLVTKFAPVTDLEKDVQMVMVKCGLKESDAAKTENELLMGHGMSLKEIKQKQAELAKVKALMFYEQLKRHRLNKIKSKAYHRIRKRQKTRASGKSGEGEADDSGSDSGEDGEEENEEDIAAKRVRERMDLRHQNTGKWAKMAKTRGQYDKSLKNAYNESILLGQSIRKKMEEDPTEGGAAEEEDHIDVSTSAKFAKAVKDQIDDEDESNRPEESSRFGKLLSMDFMKQAAAKQKEKALVEAQSVLRQLRELETSAADASDSDNDRRANAAFKAKQPEQFSIARTSKAEDVVAAKRKVEEMLTENGTSFSMSAPKKGSKFDNLSSAVAIESSLPAAEANSPWKMSADESTTDAANPWLASKADIGKAGGTRKANSAANKELEKTVYLSSNATITPNSNSSKPATKASTNSKPTTATTASDNLITKVEDKKPLMQKKSQSDLVQLAFAGPNLESEFNKFKDSSIEDEYGIDKLKAKVNSDVKAGWGDWAVPGAPMGASNKTLMKRDKLMSKIEKEAAEKKAQRKDSKIANVMFSEKRVKGEAKYKLSDVPHPYTSREEYERSIQMPVGGEWNASHVVRANTKPDILTRAGRVIDVIKLDKKKTKSV